MIPVNEPVISPEAKANVAHALATGWLSSAGPFVKQFEDDFAKFLGVKHAISANTGTAALHVALLAAGIGAGDEVIVPAFTMAATYLAIIYVGAIPVFVDVDPVTYNINPELITSKITKKTKAILPVHIYGHPAPMAEIMKIAQEHKLTVIEDAAEAHGATYQGKVVGGISDIGCFSFYANKLITTGEGGMVVTNNDDFASEARKFKDLYHSTAKRFIHEKVGYNYRMTNLQAAVGVGELKHISEYIGQKQHMAERYNAGLSGIKGIVLPTTLEGCTNVYWMYAVRLTKDFGMTKDQLRAKLLDMGIETRDFFYSPSDQPILKQYLRPTDTFPVTDELSQTGFYPPSGLAITDAQIDEVSKAIAGLGRSM